MNFSEDYILENSCVLLQPLHVNHAVNLLHFAIEEPEIWIYSLVPVAGEQHFKNYITQALEGHTQLKEYPFVVYDKRTQEYAGSTRFYDIQVANKVLQLGYTWYGKKFQGTGLNKHCKYLLLGFAFEKLGMERVEFRADNNNARSIAAMKSIGCKVDGVLRSNMPMPDGGRRDSIVLSILKSEWEQQVKAALFAKLQW
jgi:RimJ/RimL family protein N-acetyltransferase